MKQSIFISLFLLTLFSCGNEPEKADIGSDNQPQPALPISDFIKKFRIIQPPFYYLGGNVTESYKNQLFELKKNSNDTLFYNTNTYDLPAYGLGMLADTSMFYSLIIVHTAENNYPVLYTYSKSGKLLGREPLLVRGCGSDCGLKYCSSAAHIDKNLSIYIADTSRYEGMCDSAGNYIEGDSTFIFSKTGSINKSGIIKMNEEREQRIGGKK